MHAGLRAGYLILTRLCQKISPTCKRVFKVQADIRDMFCMNTLSGVRLIATAFATLCGQAATIFANTSQAESSWQKPNGDSTPRFLKAYGCKFLPCRTGDLKKRCTQEEHKCCHALALVNCIDGQWRGSRGVVLAFAIVGLAACRQTALRQAACPGHPLLLRQPCALPLPGCWQGCCCAAAPALPAAAHARF